MSNILLAYRDRVRTGTLAAGSWSGTLPLVNVQDPRLAKVARTLNARRSSTRLRCKFATPESIRALAIINHNLSVIAKWRARAGRASLDVIFDSDTADERITFSGGVNGTRVNKDGLIQAATRTNMAIRAQEFDNASWTKTNATVTANAVSSPPFDNTTTADALVETAAAGAHRVSQAWTAVIGLTYTISVYAKKAGRDFLFMQDGLSPSVWFDLANGVIASVNGTATASMVHVGNGLYRCSMSYPAATTTPTAYIESATANGVSSYTGTASLVALYLWGAQIEASPFATDYIATTAAAVTVTDPRIDYDPRNRVTNLFTQSENPTSSATGWPTFTAAVSSAPLSRPGTTAFNAFKINEDSTTAAHGVNQSVAALPGGVSTLSVYAKAGERTRLALFKNGTGYNMARGFDLATGTTFANTSGYGEPLSYSMTALADGWYRCSMQVASDGVGSSGAGLWINNGTLDTYTGDGVSGLYYSAPQLQTGWQATAYIPTTTVAASAYQDFGPVRTNLLPYSKEFENAAWTASGTSVTANFAVAPDGTTTADAIAFAAVNDQHIRFTLNLRAGQQYTLSVWAKTNSGDPAFALKLSDGVSDTQSNAFTATGTWQRVNHTFTARIDATNGNASLLKRTGAGSIVFWGAQLEEGDTATDYIQTFSTANTSPEGCRGLLAEEARTNIVVPSIPTVAWNDNGTLGGWIDNYGIAPDGSKTTVLATGTGTRFKAISTAASTTYTYSIFVKQGSGAVYLLYIDAGAGVLAAGVSSITVYVLPDGQFYNPSSAPAPVSYGVAEKRPDGWMRLFMTFTTTGGGMVSHHAYPIGGSWEIWGAQSEAGAFPTSYIPTTSTPVTRTQDVHTGTNLTTLGYDQRGGTLYAEFSVLSTATANNRAVIAVDDGSSNNLAHLLATAAGTMYGEAFAGGVSQALIPSGAVAAGVTQRAAFSFATNDASFTRDGAAPASDSVFSVPTVTTFYLGGRAGGLNPLNGHLKRAAYFPPTPLTGAELQTITTDGPDAIGYNSGWIDALQMTFHGDVPADWGSQYALMTAFDAIEARYLTVEFDDEANAAGYLDIGQLFAADGFQPEFNPAYGLQSGRDDLSSVTSSISGVRYATARRRPRTERFSLPWLNQSEADEIHEMQGEIGTVDDVLDIPDPDDMAYSQRYGFLGHLSELSALDYPYPLIRATAFQLKEKL